MKKLSSRIRGWYPKEPTVPSALSISVQEERFHFDKRFYVGLAVSYLFFTALVVVPFLLGYIDSTFLGYGVAGIVESLFLMAMVRALNDRPNLRKRLSYVAVGVWLGFAVFALSLVLFPHQLLAAGSWAMLLLLTVAPSAGGMAGFLASRRKYGVLKA